MTVSPVGSGLLEHRPVSQADIEDFYGGIVGIAYREVIEEFSESKPGDRQAWAVAPYARVKKIWTDFSKTGFVRDSKGIDRIAQLVMNNIAKVYANTRLMDHTQESHGDILADSGDEDLIPRMEYEFPDFATDANGQYRLSDYAMDKLMEDAVAIFIAKTDAAKLLAVDTALNRVHQRSDIAGWFIEGGWENLTDLRG